MVIEQVFNYMQLNNLVGICLDLVDAVRCWFFIYFLLFYFFF